MIAPVIVVIDEGADLTFQVAGQEVVFQQNPVLHGLMPAFDLARGLRVIRCAPDVFHLLIFKPFGQFTRDVAEPVAPWEEALV